MPRHAKKSSCRMILEQVGDATYRHAGNVPEELKSDKEVNTWLDKQFDRRGGRFLVVSVERDRQILKQLEMSFSGKLESFGLGV